MAATSWGLLLFILLQQCGEIYSLTGHVCAQQRSRSVLVYIQASRRQSERYTTECGLFGREDCTRYRYSTKYYHKSAYKAQYSSTQECCPGWKQTGSTCNKPICAAPNVCTCTSGYSGARCDTDLDECSKGTHACDHNCHNTRGLHWEAVIDAAAPADQGTEVKVGFTIGVTLAVVVAILLTANSVFFVCRRYRNRDTPATKRSPAPAVTQAQDYDNVTYENAEVLTASKHRTERNCDGGQQTGPWTVQTGTRNASNPDQPFESIMVKESEDQSVYTKLIFGGLVPTPIGEYEHLSAYQRRGQQNDNEYSA